MGDCSTCSTLLPDDDAGPVCAACRAAAAGASVDALEESRASGDASAASQTTEHSSSSGTDMGSDICIPGCSLSRTDKRCNMVNCLWCRRAYHKKCVGAEAYVCDSCILMPTQINTMCETIKTLSTVVQTLQTSNDELKNTVTRQSDIISSMEKRVTSSFPMSKPRDLVIGSSMLRNLDREKLVNTDVISISGGRIRDVRKKLSDVDSSYGRISLVVGGNDCDARNDQEPIENVIEEYSALIQHAQSLAGEVHAGTILPRGTDAPGVSDRIDALNAALHATDAAPGVTIVNNDRCFKLGDESINDGYFVKDLTHLNDAGTTKLAHNMGFHIKPQHVKNVTRSYSAAVKTNTANSSNKGRPPPKSQVPKASTPHKDTAPADSPRRQNQTRDNYHGNRTSHNRSDSDNRPWTTVSPSRRSWTPDTHREPQRDNGSCDYCGERNHRKDSCNHGRSVRCDRCHNHGHKSKHCKRH